MWNRSTAAGNGDRPNQSLAGLSRSGMAAPAIPASTAWRRADGDAAVRAPATARLISPSATATRRNWRQPSLPQCGTASRTKCDATPAAKAGSGRRVSAPISAPDKT